MASFLDIARQRWHAWQWPEFRDALLFKALLGVILLAGLWPLGLLGYLVSVYGYHIVLG